MHIIPTLRHATGLILVVLALLAVRTASADDLTSMNQKAVDWVNNTRGWEIGTGPSVVIVDKGMARSFTTDTMHSGIYAFTFDQQGLMAGLGLQGSKIMRD